MKKRIRYHKGFGHALEVYSFLTGRWLHARWVAGPVYNYQKMLRKATRSI